LFVRHWFLLNFLISAHSHLLHDSFQGGMNALVSHTGSSQVWEVESVVVLASARGDAESLVHNVALLDGELVEACWVWDVAGERACCLSISSAEDARRLIASEIECRE
jgi:hypothetical protein